MAHRSFVVLVVLGAFLSLAASYRTPNFVVHAQTPQIAQQVGQYAEHYRKQKAIQWLGREMPQWGQPCPLRVTISMNGSGGATSFAFDNGRILSQEMNIEGRLDRLLASVLPHEITHTVFAHYFRCPVPRWADEGGSVLSEDQLERSRHDRLVRNLINSRRAMPLRRLFNLRDYPREVMTLYAQGYSVTEFLVGRRGRRTFLRFVGDGMRQGWDTAARANYGYRSVEDLSEAWLQHLRRSSSSAPNLVARGDRPRSSRPVQPRRDEVVVRQTVPPTQPLLSGPRPIVRGQSHSEELPPRYENRGFQPTSRREVRPSWSDPRACGPEGCPDSPPPAPARYRDNGTRGRFLPSSARLGAPQPIGSPFQGYPR